jgi:hypothetical protein
MRATPIQKSVAAPLDDFALKEANNYKIIPTKAKK